MATLLVVDDDDRFRALVMESLEAAGYDVIAVAQASTAAGILERHGAVDLVITAVNAPTLTGLDLLAWKDSAPEFEQVPGIVLADFKSRAGPYAEKYAFVRKPVSCLELLLTVGKHFGKPISIH